MGEHGPGYRGIPLCHVASIPPQVVQAYAGFVGWNDWSLVIPKHMDEPDYSLRLAEVIYSIADHEKKKPHLVIADLYSLIELALG